MLKGFETRPASMTSKELFDAAFIIHQAASETRTLASLTIGAAMAKVRYGAAQQLQDRADQVHAWAKTALHREDHGEQTPPDVARTIAAATHEFLQLARWQ
jgi:hypothetical protein